MSVWWLIVPTLLYAFLAHNVVNTLVLAAIGAGLGFAQTRPEVPAKIRPYLPLLQCVIVFIFLGGNVIVVAIVAAAGAAAFMQRDALVRFLQPWWETQKRIPPNLRRPLAVGLSLVVGFIFGRQASGYEWTVTFLSIITATLITFLLTFTPSDTRHRS